MKVKKIIGVGGLFDSRKRKTSGSILGINTVVITRACGTLIFGSKGIPAIATGNCIRILDMESIVHNIINVNVDVQYHRLIE